MSELKKLISDTLKTAMRAKEKERVTIIRSIQAEIKRVEVDERIEVEDDRVLAILDKMVKQRKDSFQQFTDGGREDLAEVEKKEMEVIAEFLPQQLTEEEITDIVKAAIAETGATGMQQMGAVMAIVKPQVQGRGDMSVVSKQVKALLG
ncbi:Yqey-like protein [Marinomonas aquimarina]|uniref:Yqey-like protein n=1 Tax=Marinomonas aquimarina TaxID=295068 RepID=A0A1A8TLS6_9GAMM|nr:GatB/YqeY domain-containing protein [Marinomonas aquimarina]SBS33757.1 Yqey-like protein [Marinomonas aquimarina]